MANKKKRPLSGNGFGFIKPLKNKGGRPLKTFTKEAVELFEKLCHMQCVKKEITACLNIANNTLDRLILEHYGKPFAEVYAEQSAIGLASLRRALWRQAHNGNFHAQKFLAKNLLGMREVFELTPDAPAQATPGQESFVRLPAYAPKMPPPTIDVTATPTEDSNDAS